MARENPPPADRDRSVCELCFERGVVMLTIADKLGERVVCTKCWREVASEAVT